MQLSYSSLPTMASLYPFGSVCTCSRILILHAIASCTFSSVYAGTKNFFASFECQPIDAIGINTGEGAFLPSSTTDSSSPLSWSPCKRKSSPSSLSLSKGESTLACFLVLYNSWDKGVAFHTMPCLILVLVLVQCKNITIESLPWSIFWLGAVLLFHYPCIVHTCIIVLKISINFGVLFQCYFSWFPIQVIKNWSQQYFVF